MAVARKNCRLCMWDRELAATSTLAGLAQQPHALQRGPRADDTAFARPSLRSNDADWRFRRVASGGAPF